MTNAKQIERIRVLLTRLNDSRIFKYTGHVVNVRNSGVVDAQINCWGIVSGNLCSSTLVFVGARGGLSAFAQNTLVAGERAYWAMKSDLTAKLW